MHGHITLKSHSLYPSGFPAKFCVYVIPPASGPWFDHTYVVWRTVRIVKCPMCWRRAMALAPNHLLLIAEARSRSKTSPRGICGGENGPGTGLTSGASVFCCQYGTTNASYSHISFICHRRCVILAIDVVVKLNTSVALPQTLCKFLHRPVTSSLCSTNILVSNFTLQLCHMALQEWDWRGCGII